MPLLGAAAWLGGLAAHLLPGAGRVGRSGRRGAVLAGGPPGRAGGDAPDGADRGRGAAGRGRGGLRRPGAAGPAGPRPRGRLAGTAPPSRCAGTVTSDPRQIRGRFGDQVLVRMEVDRLTGRGRRTTWRRPCSSSPTRAGGTRRWGPPCAPPGGCRPRTERISRRCSAPAGRRTCSPGRTSGGGAPTRCAASLRESVAGRPAHQRALVPALVDGDDAAVDPALADDFRATGLTHLLAVSGTNLTLVVGFLMVLARWAGCGAGGCTSSARAASPGSCCWRAPSRACCGPR